jgi:hypothetical protein
LNDRIIDKNKKNKVNFFWNSALASLPLRITRLPIRNLSQKNWQGVGEGGRVGEDGGGGEGGRVGEDRGGGEGEGTGVILGEILTGREKTYHRYRQLLS